MTVSLTVAVSVSVTFSVTVVVTKTVDMLGFTGMTVMPGPSVGATEGAEVAGVDAAGEASVEVGAGSVLEGTVEESSGVVLVIELSVDVGSAVEDGEGVLAAAVLVSGCCELYSGEEVGTVLETGVEIETSVAVVAEAAPGRTVV